MPNAELRDAVLRAHARGEITFSGLARDLGLGGFRKRANRPSSGWKPDATFLRRMLGIVAYKSKDGKAYNNKTIKIEYAEKIMHLLGLDPIDVGL